MTIQLLNNKSEENKVDKTVDVIFTLTGTLREESSILTPSILVNNVTVELFSNVNYMYIPDFNRYYFITNITCIKNKLFRIDGRVDVLFSFSSDIKLQTALIERQQELFTGLLNDEQLPIKQNPGFFARGLNQEPGFLQKNWNYILITVGNGIVDNPIPEPTEEVTANEQPLNQPNKTQSSQMEENT